MSYEIVWQGLGYPTLYLLPIRNKKYPKIRKPVMRTNKGIHIRLKPEEKKQLETESTKTGHSVPYLLKNAYFSEKQISVLMPHDIATKYLKELGRISEALNELREQASKEGLSEHLIALKDISDSKRIIMHTIGQLSGNN